jgi:hypothetical protein
MLSGGALKVIVARQFPVVLGGNGAGVLDAVGEGLDDVSLGDAVICHVLIDGALDHHCVTRRGHAVGDLRRDRGRVAHGRCRAADPVRARDEGTRDASRRRCPRQAAVTIDS